MKEKPKTARQWLTVSLVRDLTSILLGAYGLNHFLTTDDNRYWLAMICAGLLVGWVFLPDNFIAKRVGGNGNGNEK